MEDLQQKYSVLKNTVNSKIARVWNRNSTVGHLDVKKDVAEIQSILSSVSKGFYYNMELVKFQELLETNLDNKLNNNPNTPEHKKENFKKYILKDSEVFYEFLNIRKAMLLQSESLERQAKKIRELVA